MVIAKNKFSFGRMRLSVLKFFEVPIRYFSAHLAALSKIVKYRRYLEELNLSSRNDIYISTFMKSGTTWMQMILYQLTSHGEMDFKHIYEISPWLELYMERDQRIKFKSSLMFFKTHLDYRLFPRKFSGKFIVVLRNGMDASVSQYHHFKDWGMPNLTFQESFHKFFAGDSGHKNWFEYTRRWMENRKKLNILYIKYEDLIANFEEVLLKIADFCGLSINEDEMPRILKKCSFDYMKLHEDKFGAPRPNFDILRNFIRIGKAGKGSTYYDDELIRSYKKQFTKQLSKFELLREYMPD
ncbi:sulfotransferase domain-containing protein [Pedobacter roseus]|uniref:Sulfotransferase domain-containing protein n=1 Tax=Pedobacter roseus TaxID=336820 RepID=A0A7G9QKR2_9SPHI|nr:sulfotransferase domain-containing protein [Pedobacter roseus]QNN43937.1 sulfotransferase domain-containing protein [Pedobacter roseus]